MTYIKYNKKIKAFYSENERPNNQSSPETLKRVAKRLTDYISDNDDLCLTKLQAKFVEKVPKNKPFLNAQHIDVAHHIAISEIIDVLVEFMNEPNDFRFKDLYNFADAVCSTESSEDDKGRSFLSSFFEDVIEGTCKPEELCTRVNEIIKLVNRCSRNLIPGNSSVNRSIGQSKDLHLVGVKGRPELYEETTPSKNISKAFAKLPNCSDYSPKSQATKNRYSFLSSSVNSKVKDSYVSEVSSNSDNRRFKN